MSEFRAEIVKIGEIKKLETADTLGVTYVRGWPVVVKMGEFKEGDLACYIPVDAIVPATAQFAFLEKYNYRVRSMKLRKQLSQGLLIKAPDGVEEGDDITTLLGIKKYEFPIPVEMSGIQLPTVGKFCRYREIERYENYAHRMFANDTTIVVQEKIHGSNIRMGYLDDTFYIGSHNCRLDPDGTSIYARLAKQYDMKSICKVCPNMIFFAEAYGKKMASLDYGLKDQALVFYDIFDITKQTYIDYDIFVKIIHALKLTFVPLLGRGIYGELKQQLRYMTNKKTTLGNECHMSEGVVIKSVPEEYVADIGAWRAVKLKSEDYALKFE